MWVEEWGCCGHEMRDFAEVEVCRMFVFLMLMLSWVPSYLN